MQGAKQVHSLERYLLRLERLAYFIDNPHRALIYYGIGKARELERLVGLSRGAQATLEQLPGNTTAEKLLYYLTMLTLRPEKAPTLQGEALAYAKAGLERPEAVAWRRASAMAAGKAPAGLGELKALLKARAEEYKVEWLKSLAEREPFVALKVMALDRLSRITGGDFRIEKLRNEEEAKLAAEQFFPQLWGLTGSEKLAQVVWAIDKLREGRGEPTLAQRLGVPPQGGEEKSVELIAEVIKWGVLADVLGVGFTSILPVEEEVEVRLIPAYGDLVELRERLDRALGPTMRLLEELYDPSAGLRGGEDDVRYLLVRLEKSKSELRELRDWAREKGLSEDEINQFIADLQRLSRFASGVLRDLMILERIEKGRRG